MTKINLNGIEYICDDEKRLKEELIKKGCKSTNYLKESFDSNIIYIIADGLMWYINGKVLDRIIKEVPDLFKRKR